jgi:hypothetical protein
MSGLMVCSTNTPALDSVADVIMPKLGFVRRAGDNEVDSAKDAVLKANDD